MGQKKSVLKLGQFAADAVLPVGDLECDTASAELADFSG
jgi:hypothetical protein